MTKTLVTSALPYANGDIHIGHLVEYIQTDIYVRFLRMRGEDVIYVCASDTHGTPIEVNARKKGMTPEEMVAMFHERQKRDFDGFDISFDVFYTTHSEETRHNAYRIFEGLRDGGLIDKRGIDQLYCPNDERFLPDRFVRGTCPKCGATDQYGDACEVCGATYEPTELIEPKCALCGTTPELRHSTHYFVILEKARDAIEKWVEAEGHLHPDVRDWLKSNFLKETLHDWDVSRDAPYFGFRIPGEEDKFFYVWLDAPVGYIGSTEKWCRDNGLDYLRDYWSPEADSRIIHFIGKDIVYFHTLFWPAMLHYGGFRMPDRVQIHGFLTVNGEKMSKSRGTSVKAETYLKHLDPQYLRFYYAYKLTPGLDDLDLNLVEFRERVNAELVNKIANLASRTHGLLRKRLEGRMTSPRQDFEPLRQEMLKAAEKATAHYEAFEFGRAIREIARIAEIANKYIQDTEPFRLAKSDPDEARAILSGAVGAIKGIAILLGPVLPGFKEKIERAFGAERSWTWKDLDFMPDSGQLGEFERLVERMEEEAVQAMIDETKDIFAEGEAPADEWQPDESIESFRDTITFDDFAKVDLRVGRILSVEEVPEARKLYRLVVDLGREKRQVFAGLKKYFRPEELQGKSVVVVANLAPRKMRFGVSEAMLLAAEDPDGNLTMVVPDDSSMKPGSTIS